MTTLRTARNFAFGAMALVAAAARAEPPAPPDDAAAITGLEQAHQELFARVAPSVVLLTRGGASGSGFFVRDRLVLTNRHVAGEAGAIDVFLADGRHARGEVVESAGGLDLALVEVPLAAPVLALGDPGSLREGSFAAAVGLGAGAGWTFATGIISHARPLGEGSPLLQAQLPLRRGSSGAPLVDARGRAVGIVTSGALDAAGFAFAIRADAAVRAFPRLRAAPGEPPAAVPIAASAATSTELEKVTNGAAAIAPGAMSAAAPSDCSVFAERRIQAPPPAKAARRSGRRSSAVTVSRTTGEAIRPVSTAAPAPLAPAGRNLEVSIAFAIAAAVLAAAALVFGIRAAAERLGVATRPEPVEGLNGRARLVRSRPSRTPP